MNILFMHYRKQQHVAYSAQSNTNSTSMYFVEYILFAGTKFVYNDAATFQFSTDIGNYISAARNRRCCSTEKPGVYIIEEINTSELNNTSSRGDGRRKTATVPKTLVKKHVLFSHSLIKLPPLYT